jgi:hypothetical protein
MTATSRQVLEQTVLILPEAEKLWLMNLILDQLQVIPETMRDRIEDLEDTGLHQAMLAVETPLSREAALAELDRP